jgi:hypothetical protein
VRKLDARGSPSVFIGYEPGAKVWCIYDLASRRVVVSRDVVFDVMASWTTKDEEMDPSGDFILEFHTLKIGSEHKGSPEPIVGMSTLSPAALALEPMTPAPTASPPPQPEFV